jgi:hypothetical protein
MKRFRPIILAASGFILFLLAGFLDVAVPELANKIICGLIAAVSFAMIIIGLFWGIFSGALPTPLRAVSGVLLVLLGGLCFVAYCYAIALRGHAIGSAKGDLKIAIQDYATLGYTTNRSSHSEVWRSSNIVTIAGTEYLCSFTVRTDRLHNEGVLAVTTNQVFIWLDDKRGPKIIGPGYRPPFFPPRF